MNMLSELSGFRLKISVVSEKLSSTPTTIPDQQCKPYRSICRSQHLAFAIHVLQSFNSNKSFCVLHGHQMLARTHLSLRTCLVTTIDCHLHDFYIVTMYRNMRMWYMRFAVIDA